MITIRGLKSGTNAIIMILVVFVILVLLNIIMMRFLIRIDLTEGNIYSVSKSTKNAIKKLDDIININVYFSKDLPPQLTNRAQQVKDILSEYQAYGQGNLRMEYIDPKSDPKLEEKMRFMGIPELQAQVLEQDKVTAQKVYLGIEVLFEDKKQVIPVVQNVNTFEYDLTSAILKVASPEEKTIGFLTGHDEHDIYDEQNPDSYSRIREALQKQYATTAADTTKGNKIQDNINTLIVAGPKKALSERDKYEIDQFIMRGGRAIFLVDSIKISPGSIQATPLNTGLNDLLEHYGVKLGNNLVVDTSSNAMVPFRMGYSQLITNYPLFPKVAKRNFNKEHVITSQLESLTLPWTSSLEIVAQESDELKAVALAQTSEDAWEMHSPYDLNPQPQQKFYRTPSDRKTLTLAIELSGKFKSFYADKGIPKVDKDDAEEGSKAETDDSEREGIKEVENTQIIVIGNSSFIDNGHLSDESSVFFLNAVDWLTLGEELVNIRSRTATDRPLKEVSAGTKSFIKFICTLGIPIIVVVIGAVKFLMRRRAKRMFEVYGAQG